MRYHALLLILCQFFISNICSAQEENFNIDDFEDGSTVKKFCTQKVINQSPNKLYGLAYEYSTGFTNREEVAGTEGPLTSIAGFGGARAIIGFLPVSKNNFIWNVGLTYWASKVFSSSGQAITSYSQELYLRRMEVIGLYNTFFKPLNEKHFIIAQVNADMSMLHPSNRFRFDVGGLTLYGSALFGWKKGDYRMLGIGASRTYRMGRPIIVPVLLYNKTFNEAWGVECLFPARAHVRYTMSVNRFLMAGYELEGQQYQMGILQNQYLQRGEIKPRLVYEQKLKGFVWLSTQLGYRINGRFNVVNRYDGQEANEIIRNRWGSSPYVNIGIYFVTP